MKNFRKISFLFIAFYLTVTSSKIFASGSNYHRNNSLKYYEVELSHIESLLLYRLTPTYITQEEMKNNLGIGFVSGVLNEVILSPLTIIGSPFIIKNHLKHTSLLNIIRILEEVFRIDNSKNDDSPYLVKLIKSLQLKFPQNEQVQNLTKSIIKNIIITADQNNELAQPLFSIRPDEEKLLYESLVPRKILTYTEFKKLIFEKIIEK